MHVCADSIETIGRAPLIRLRRASEASGCEILGKAEFLNPGGSVKDRAALYIVRDAEARGELRPGGVLVEGTAGNTGSGLALDAMPAGHRRAAASHGRERTGGPRLAVLVAKPAKNNQEGGNYD